VWRGFSDRCFTLGDSGEGGVAVAEGAAVVFQVGKKGPGGFGAKILDDLAPGFHLGVEFDDFGLKLVFWQVVKSARLSRPGPGWQPLVNVRGGRGGRVWWA